MAIMTTMTDEQIAYAYEYCRVKIHEHHIAGITREDIEDLLQFCLGNLAKKYKYDDQRGVKWTTYIQACCKTILVDAYRWHYRQHQRMQMVPMDDDRATDPDITDAIDAIDDDLLRELCRLKYEGCHPMQIIAKLKLSKVEYDSAMMRLHEVLTKSKEN